jgi:hypothetical protein
MTHPRTAESCGILPPDEFYFTTAEKKPLQFVPDPQISRNCEVFTIPRWMREYPRLRRIRERKRDGDYGLDSCLIKFVEHGLVFVINVVGP